MTSQEKLRLLEELTDSQGWALLKEQMHEEILQAAYQLAENKPISADELHFKRGAIWAARKMLDLPLTMKTLINNDIMMQMAQVEES